MEVYSCFQGEPACGLSLAAGCIFDAMIVLMRRHHGDAEVRGEAELSSAWTLRLRSGQAREAPVPTLPHTSILYPLPLAISTARKTARDLFSDSSNSRCGSESATIPAPACK